MRSRTPIVETESPKKSEKQVFSETESPKKSEKQPHAKCKVTISEKSGS